MSATEFALSVGAPDEDDVLRDAEPDRWSARFDEFAMSEGAEEAASLRLAQLRADAGVSVTTLVVPGGTIVWWSTKASADRPAEAGQFRCARPTSSPLPPRHGVKAEGVGGGAVRTTFLHCPPRMSRARNAVCLRASGGEDFPRLWRPPLLSPPLFPMLDSL